MKMSARGRIVDVKYDQRSAHLHLIYETGTASEVDLLKFGNLPFSLKEILGGVKAQVPSSIGLLSEMLEAGATRTFVVKPQVLDRKAV
jgi:hypothetical protein